jgi:hypothetical protein
VLVIGGGVYIYESKKTETPLVVNTETQLPSQNQQQTNTQTLVVTQPKVSPVPATTPLINVISPNGSEIFKQNSPITVEWSQNFSAYASICLIGDAGCVYNSTPVMFNAGVNTWTIPANTNVTTCTINNCYIANGFKIRITTDNQPGSGQAGEFMNDESNNYFVIVPQTGLQAVAFLQQMQTQIGTNYEMQATVGYQNIPGYKISLPSNQFTKASNYLVSKFGTQNNKYTSERGYGYENWHLLCMSIGLGAGSSSSNQPYIWCADKVGAQKIDVIVRDIKSIDTDTRTFMLTVGTETMKVRMPTVVQNTSYQNGTFADFVKAITSNQYQTSTFQMNGELKGDVFEATNIQWILG